MSQAEQAVLAPSEEVLSLPFATVNGLAITLLPKDLYIPPDAMKVFLEAFEGPLDFLLYLIRKQNLDILNIPIADVTRQYMKYIDIMKNLSLDLAAEYLVMAAILAEVKSRMLLPRSVEVEAQEDDPRAELVKRLQEYERYKQAALDMDKLQRLERDTMSLAINSDFISVPKPMPVLVLNELTQALADVLKRLELSAHHQVHIDGLSVQEKMTMILASFENKEHLIFSNLFNIDEGKHGIVVTFLAMLELLKQHMIEFVQAAAFAPIYLHLTTTDKKVDFSELTIS